MPSVPEHSRRFLVGMGSNQTMEFDMKSVTKLLLPVTLGAGVLAFSALSASAGISCVGPVCWHTHEAFDYPPAAGVVVHPDDWRWGAQDHYSWREHEGRGYWNGDKWMDR
jgi:hypothetical protein